MNRRDWRDRWRREWHGRDRAESWFIALSIAVALAMLLLWLFGVTPLLELLS